MFAKFWRDKKDREDSIAANSAEERIPVLTDVVEKAVLVAEDYSNEELAALEEEISHASLRLAEQLLHEVSREMEVVMFDRVLSRMRDELPALVDKILREHLQRKS